ncbi:MAG TPA: maleylpyruvate isomerase family mycothiol-dependent enzyme [Jiangellaceae bacterium]|nr:maleylpyruvate isomerase family mycothiol-dependent enzyme [Jiangellaceae bacterium]
MHVGTAQFADAVDRLDDAALDQAAGLPGWSRRHVLAHLAANAEALQRLVHWASTGEERRMYSSPEQRNADIEEGSTRPAAELRTWVRRSADRLAAELDALDEAHWAAEVATAQGRAVPASEIPWLRAREVLIHAVDLDAGVEFDDLPEDFLVQLVSDVVAKRSLGSGPAVVLRTADAAHEWQITGSSPAVTVSAALPEIAAWVTGRPTKITDANGGAPLPELSAWL